MSTERLDRIEAIVEANAAGMAELRATTQANAAAIQANAVETAELKSTAAELKSTANALLQIVEIHQRNWEVSQRNFEVGQQRMDAMLAEIKGLRTESQRILEYLFGRQENNG